MIWIKNLHLLIFLIFLFIKVKAQPDNTNDRLEEIIQGLMQDNQENLNYEEVYENLILLYAEPIDLNTAESEDLERLYILTSSQINQLLIYRKQTGPFISLYELQSIPSFDKITIEKILPFIVIKNKITTKNLLKDIIHNDNHYLLFRMERTLELKKGFDKDSLGNKIFEGNANKYYIRYRNSKTKNFTYGVTLENDPGEILFANGANKFYSFDFISAHIGLFHKGKIKSLFIGDYQMQFGQGLILGAGFSLGKGTETILSVKRNNLGIRPYTSSSENNFMRGTAITYFAKPFEITVFVSSKNIDASLNDTINLNYSLVQTGYHRTVNEIFKRKNISEKIAGGNVSFLNKEKRFHAGITTVFTSFNVNIEKKFELYNAYDFKGKNNLVTSIDASYLWKNFIFFGEAAISQSSGKGIVSGFVSSLASWIDFSMLYRNYEKNFHSLYGNAFSENTDNKNEKGMYWGIKLKFSRKWLLSSYYDQFKFPWLKYQIDAPSRGYEYLNSLSYSPFKGVGLAIQYREENKEKNFLHYSGPMDLIVPTIKRNYSFKIEMNPALNLWLKSRIQFSSWKQENYITYGYLFSQDIALDLNRFTLASRFALFDTDDFENRQYAYERDILYNFSIPFYYGKGLRTYILLKYKFTKNIDCWLRYSRTNYYDQKSIGSGLDEIEGNKKTDIKIQVRYNF